MIPDKWKVVWHNKEQAPSIVKYFQDKYKAFQGYGYNGKDSGFTSDGHYFTFSNEQHLGGYIEISFDEFMEQVAGHPTKNVVNNTYTII